MMTKDDLPDVWTDQHDKELKFNAGKQLSRVFEHMRSGAIKADEVTPEVVALCTAFYQDKLSTMMKREGAEKRVKRLVCRGPPKDTEVLGLRVYVEDDAYVLVFPQFMASTPASFPLGEPVIKAPIVAAFLAEWTEVRN